MTPTSLRDLLTTHGLLVVRARARPTDDDLGALLRAVAGSGPVVDGRRAADLLVGPPGHRFSDQHRAFETLPGDVRDWLIGRRARWSASGPDEMTTWTDPRPVFRRHPLNGRVALHLPPPGRTATISGLPDDVAAATILRLRDHAGCGESLLHPSLADGDVVLWDSWSVRLVPVSTQVDRS